MTIEKAIWNRCDYCGKFISFADFEADKADRIMHHAYNPLTVDMDEDYETFHRACKAKSEAA